MSTRSRYSNQMLRFYDGYETVGVLAPVMFYDDFLGYALAKYTANENTTAP